MLKTPDPRTILVHNSKIYCSGKEDFTWMIFDEVTGNIRQLGRGNPPVSIADQKSAFDLGGRRVLPGLHDSHLHLSSYGKTSNRLSLYNCSSIAELQQRLRDYCQEHPKERCVVGYQWEHDKLGRYPTREDLDGVCPDKPVVLTRVCFHVAVVNSAALQLIGIDRNSIDREGSQIDRYPEEHTRAGEPNGILREASFYFKSLVTPTKEEHTEYIKDALTKCLAYGITSIDALEEDTWDIYCGLVDSDSLPIRIFYVPYYSGRHGDNFPSAGDSRGSLLSCDRIKLFSDGALGASTAALSIPYKGTDNKGLLLKPQEEMTDLVADATSRGYRLEIHAIGDAAAGVVLNSLEIANVAAEKRPIIVHCQVLRQDLLPRMKIQGVIASIQPQFVLTDARWLDGLLPQELLEFTYPWKTLLEKGIPCCGGSDAPVESPEPLLGIYDAIFRPADQRGKGNKECFRPDEKLSVTEAIDLYTKGGAYATMREHCLGQLLPGYQADFIVLDAERDVCEHPEEFCQAKVAQVWVAGQRKL